MLNSSLNSILLLCKVIIHSFIRNLDDLSYSTLSQVNPDLSTFKVIILNCKKLDAIFLEKQMQHPISADPEKMSSTLKLK